MAPIRRSRPGIANNNNGEATSSRKRKMKEVMPQTTALPAPPVALFPHFQLLPAPPNTVPTNLRLDLGQQDKFPLLSRPFTSFTSLLTEADGDDEHVDPLIKQHIHHVNQIINSHTDNLRCTLENLWMRQYNVVISQVEERAAKKMREKQMEVNKLEDKVAYYRAQTQVWQGRAETMEASLKVALQKLAAGEGSSGLGRRSAAEVAALALVEEEAESSYVDPNWVKPVKLDCKMCGKGMATVVLWPCRHVCLCIRCDPIVKACPVCQSPKANSMEVRLSDEI